MLGELLGAGTWRTLLDAMDETQRDGETHECGVFRISPEIRDRLAECDVGEIARRWADTEEMRHWTLEDVCDDVSGLRELARTAIAEDKQLWHWSSL